MPEPTPETSIAKGLTDAKLSAVPGQALFSSDAAGASVAAGLGKGGAPGLGNTGAPVPGFTVDDAIDLMRTGAFRTGEFWFFAVALAVANALAVDGILHGNVIGLIDALTPLAYQWLRQNFKDAQHARIIDLLGSTARAGAASGVIK
ncbi:MAG TPA: hypothetical protein VHY22_13380 [Chthoniobacteraceae bacterium]|jgi:hypothetical protein|nr:hypothetical protein [Chthoniobacteraceae bacterium]